MAALTLRAYGWHRRAKGLPGGSLQAVQRALKRGWIHAEPDGRIEPGRADREWAALTVERVSIYRPGTRRLKSEGDRPAAKGEKRPADPEPDDTVDWSLTRRLRRLLGGWLTHVRAINDALEAEVERTNDDGVCPPTGIPQLDAYVDFMNHIHLAHNALEQAVDPALVEYRPRCDCPPECPVHPRPLDKGER